MGIISYLTASTKTWKNEFLFLLFCPERRHFEIMLGILKQERPYSHFFLFGSHAMLRCFPCLVPGSPMPPSRWPVEKSAMFVSAAVFDSLYRIVPIVVPITVPLGPKISKRTVHF